MPKIEEIPSKKQKLQPIKQFIRKTINVMKAITGLYIAVIIPAALTNKSGIVVLTTYLFITTIIGMSIALYISIIALKIMKKRLMKKG